MGSDESKEGEWYRSMGGIAVITVDMVLLVALVVGTTGFGGQIIDGITGSGWEAGVTVPWFVYIYGVLGAMGYVLTMLVRDFGRSSTEMAQHNLRLPAALPLAAGVYLLSERFIGSGNVEMLAALSFATGLLVNTAYLRIRDLSVRLLSTQDGDDEEEEDVEDTPASGDEVAADSEGRRSAGPERGDGVGAEDAGSADAVDDGAAEESGEGDATDSENGGGDGTDNESEGGDETADDGGAGDESGRSDETTSTTE